MGQIIHRRKLFGGVKTAEQVHAEALGKPCAACGQVAVATLRTFAPLSELGVDTLALIASKDTDSRVPVVTTKHGKFVRMGMAYACKACLPAAERIAAKHPSSWFVEIDRGPGPDAPVVAVM